MRPHDSGVGEPDTLVAPPSLEETALLVVNGHVPVERSFGLSVLQSMERRKLGPIDVACLTGRSVARVESYAGVRLTDILDATELPTLHRSELKRCVVIATGQDGYQALFSWCELYNSPIGAQVLVLFEREDQPLEGHMGELALISAADTHIGPRHLRHLRSITARLL